MGWLIVLGILVALAWLPLGVSLRYDADGFRFRWLAGWIPIPAGGKQEKKKEKKKTNKKKGKRTASATSSAKPQGKKKGGSLADFIPLVQVVLEFLDVFRWKMRVRRLEMKLIMASSDPCDLAVNYGRAWAALGNLMPQLERCFAIKKRNLEVECDFEASENVIIARVDLVITVGRLLRISVRYGLRAVKEFFTLKKLRKGGASK